MKNHFLFPNSFKKIGWILFVPSYILISLNICFDIDSDKYFNMNVFAIYQDSIGLKSSFFTFIKNNIFEELLIVSSILGSIFIGFSKLKNEDEYISKIRYESLVWATYLNYGLILFFTLFIYGMTFLDVVFYNMFILLLFFIIRFHYKIYQLNKATNDDE